MFIIEQILSNQFIRSAAEFRTSLRSSIVTSHHEWLVRPDVECDLIIQVWYDTYPSLWPTEMTSCDGFADRYHIYEWSDRISNKIYYNDTNYYDIRINQ